MDRRGEIMVLQSRAGTFFVNGGRMLVRLGSFHCQFSLHSGQYFAVLVQYRVPGVGSLFKFGVSLILKKKKETNHFIHLKKYLQI